MLRDERLSVRTACGVPRVSPLLAREQWLVCAARAHASPPASLAGAVTAAAFAAASCPFSRSSSFSEIGLHVRRTRRMCGLHERERMRAQSLPSDSRHSDSSAATPRPHVCDRIHHSRRRQSERSANGRSARGIRAAAVFRALRAGAGREQSGARALERRA